jgi:hypothetical protein
MIIKRLQLYLYIVYMKHLVSLVFSVSILSSLCQSCLLCVSLDSRHPLLEAKARIVNEECTGVLSTVIVLVSVTWEYDAAIY